MKSRAVRRPRAALEENVSDPLWHLARQLFNYDEHSGQLIWVYDWSWGRSHNEAGTIKKHGRRRYRVVGFNGRKYLAHQLIWFWITASWAPMVDHIDGNGLNNAQRNLRQATPRANAENRHTASRRSRTGLLGIYPHKNQFRAEIIVAGRKHRLGTFPSKEQAHQAYVEAKRRLHVGCAL